MLTERDSEMNVIIERNRAMERFIQEQQRQMIKVKSSEECESLMTLYMERNEELRSAICGNQLLSSNVKGLEKIVNDLSSDAAKEREKTAQKIAEMEKKIADLEEEGESQRNAMMVAEEANEEKHELIQSLKQENKELKQEVKQCHHTMAQLKREISVLRETEERIGGLETDNVWLVEEIERLNTEKNKDSLEIQNMEILVNAQRQGMEELENLVSTYENRFLAKDVDVPKLLARADEGERLWSKIEEREKRLRSREVFLGVLRDDNANMLSEKKKLQAEIEDLKNCLENVTIKLSTSGDESQMPWLMSQLRENISLKEKVAELEEIIANGGYTVKAAEAEDQFNKMERKLAREMENLTEVIDMLQGQLGGVDDFEVPVVLGKLEEALLTMSKSAGDTSKDNALGMCSFTVERDRHTVSTVCSDVSEYSKDEWEGGCFMWKGALCGPSRMESATL